VLASVIAAAAPPLDARIAEAAWAAEVALARRLASLPGAERRKAGDGFAFATGARDNSRNGVVCSRLPAATTDARIAELLGWLRERGVPGQWHVEAATEPPDLRARLRRAGCRPERTAVVMAAALGDGMRTASPPTGVEIAPLGEAHAARRDGREIGVVRGFADEATLVFRELAVVPSERLRGVGRALVGAALGDGAAAGCSLALVAPTPATVPFYEALGFALYRTLPDRVLYTPS
jgi:GNAT superfamily N-acetyltransferase